MIVTFAQGFTVFFSRDKYAQRAQEKDWKLKSLMVGNISLQDLPELEEVDVKDPLFIRSLPSSHTKVRLLYISPVCQIFRV